jgi:hypothetical protein
MAFVVIAFGALFFISVFRIAFRSPFSPSARAVLLVLRFFLLMLMAVAFTEPALVFEQLTSPLRPVPVLVDASKSMRLFAHDSAVLKVMASLEKWNAVHTGEKQKFVFYRFGDSLRLIKNPMDKSTRPYSFSDRRSFFPESLNDRIFRRSAAMLIISDGNLSNAVLPAEQYSDKNVLYIPFRGLPRHYPFLQAAIRSFPQVSPVDSLIPAVVDVEGFTGKPDTITVSVTRDNRMISQRKIRVPEGFFREEVSFSTKNPSAGRHLYRFDVRSFADTLFRSCHALNTALPDRFTYAFYDPRPSLDHRFIRLALQRQPHFIESVNGGNQLLDLLVIFHWNDTARTAMNRLKPGGAALFIGCIPCLGTLSSVSSSGTAALVRPTSDLSTSPFDALDLSKLPPPSRCFFCKERPLRAVNRYISAAIIRTGKPGFDTLDVLFTGRYNRNNFIAFAATDLWRFDFWPLAIAPDEAGVFGFSERLMEFTKTTLVNGLSEELLFYPATPLSESDSLSFFAVFPTHLPVPSDLRLSVSLSSAGAAPYDTSLPVIFTGSPRKLVRFKTLPAGNYRLNVFAALSPSGATVRCSFPDSVSVDQDRSEYMVRGQNTALLRTFAQPLDDFSEPSLRSVFSSSAGTNLPVKETIRFNRSWPLLLLIFLVFSAEWILRRILKAE